MKVHNRIAKRIRHEYANGADVEALAERYGISVEHADRLARQAGSGAANRARALRVLAAGAPVALAALRRGATAQEASIEAGLSPMMVRLWMRKGAEDPAYREFAEAAAAIIDASEAAATADRVALLRAVVARVRRGVTLRVACERENVRLSLVQHYLVGAQGNTEALAPVRAEYAEAIRPRQEAARAARKIRREAQPTDKVYFIRPVGGGRIKIGYTASDVESRMRDLSTGSPVDLECVGFIFAPRAVEGWLHRRFADFCNRGEWFEPDPSLLAAVQALVEAGTVPTVEACEGLLAAEPPSRLPLFRPFRVAHAPTIRPARPALA